MDAKGVSPRDYPTMDDRGASEVYFFNVCVGAEQLIGAADDALPLVERLVDEANTAYCSEAVGCMRMMTSLTQDYAKTRKQFGRAISEFQVIQHRLVDMFMATEESVSMALFATLKLGESDEERAKAVSAAKVAIGRHGRFVGQAAVQVHGGMGVTDEMRVGHYFKRVTMLDSTFGNVDYHLKRFTALNTKQAA
jgi:alkylation response protein AidB-like acyl-CoA dehydrogenase